MNSSLMSFQQVRFGYNRRTPPVLNDLNLSIAEGKVTAILGPNGVGKTTLLYLALGWLKPWGGLVSLCGEPIERYSRRALGKQIALIPQRENLPFEYTVLEYVLLGRAAYLPPLAAPSPGDEAFAYHTLEQVGIAHLYNHSILAISGGERQLALAARALAQQPRLLLLDEPTAHLDLSNQYLLIKIIRELQKRGATILLTTHDPNLALAVSDYAILMEKGGVLVSGPVAEVITAENLSTIFRVPVKIVPLDGKQQVLWM